MAWYQRRKQKKSPSEERYSIHVLAVLRAAVEGVYLGTYFGSTVALPDWIEKAQSAGVIDDTRLPTDKGREVCARGGLLALSRNRQTSWSSDALNLVKE